MVARDETTTEARTPLTRERILQAALELADEAGVDSLSMRKVGQALGVEAMSLYNHVENKEDLLDGVVDVIVLEIEAALAAAEEAGIAPADMADWTAVMRHRALTARGVMMRHQWALPVIQSRKDATPTMLRYMDEVVGIMLAGGCSGDLTHHGLHALGSRILGFSQELYDDNQELTEDEELMQIKMQQMLALYPNLSTMAASATHDEESTLGLGCDDLFEFNFSLDITLEGLEAVRRREAGA